MIFDALTNTQSVPALAPAHRIAPLAASLAFYFAGSLSAATIKVNDSAATSVPGSCTIVDAVTSINQGSLVASSNCANTGSAFGTNDTIDLSTFISPTMITFHQLVTASALVLTKPMTISGNLDSSGKPLVLIERSVDAVARYRLIDTTANVTLRGITLSRGHGTANGGAIQAAGATHPNLTLISSIVSGSTADGSGGGIYANGAVMLNNSTIVANTANGVGGGGGIYSGPPGSVTAKDSTFYGNTAINSSQPTSGNGGAVHAYSVTLTNTTISANSSANSGGGVYSQNLALGFCTISENTAPAGSGIAIGSVIASPTVTATSTLMFGNSSNDIDSNRSSPPQQTLTGDHNLVGTATGKIALPIDTLACDPLLSRLADNGGPTKTYALSPGSCAIDTGPTFPAGTIPSDQRGSGYARRVGAATDIGAYEAQKNDRIFYDGFGL